MDADIRDNIELNMRTLISNAIAEKTTARVTAVLRDELGAGISAAQLTALTLTIYDIATGGVINSRNKINILNANGGDVDSSGNLTYWMTPADNTIITPTKDFEDHCLLFEWSSGSKDGKHEVIVKVVNLEKVG